MIQVAKSAGVSQSTVSRVVRADPRITPETAKKVWAAIESLDYKPRTKRRKRRKHSDGLRTGNIGLLLAGRSRELLEFPSIARFVGGVSENATASALNVMILEMPDPRALPVALRQQSIDGVIVIGMGPDPETARRIHPLPCVWSGGEPFDIPIVDQVTTNHAAIGGLAAEYLLGCGCRRPVFLNHVSNHSSFPFVRDAFVRNMWRSGIDVACFESMVSESAMEDETWKPETLRRLFAPLVDRLLTQAADYDGIFFPTDQQAACVDQLLKERGHSLSERAKLVSCNNDEPWLATIHPRPVTIDVHQAEQGRRALRRLVRRIKHPDEKLITLLVAPELVEPASSPR